MFLFPGMNREDLAPRIETMRSRFLEIEQALAAPDAFSNPTTYQSLSRERTRLSTLFTLYEAWCDLLAAAESNRQLIQTETDPDFRSMIQAEIEEEERLANEKEQTLLLAMIPPDPHDDRDAIMEIRPGVGGEEAALFAAALFRAYSKYAELRQWRLEVLDLTETELGGIREVTLSLAGPDVFSRLKYESGVHRVQRVPATEASGRIHTSTVTVSVLPEASETDDVPIRQEDLEISTFRASGAGGQHVNRTDSAVRIRHIPSGLTVASQQERSQLRNKEIALRILKSKLLEQIRREETERHAASRRAQIGAGDRSERIRTYNFPQNRVTDHRFGVSAYNLPGLMEGDFDLILAPLLAEDDKLKMQEFLEENV